MSESNHSHDIHVPRGALIAAGLLIAVTIAAVAGFRIAGLDPTARIPESDPALTMRQLRFKDTEQGEVAVYEVRDGHPDRMIHTVPSGEGGFVRGVLRSLARERRANGIGGDPPFVLAQLANGTLVLEDPETDQRIDLQAFGPTNIDAFRAMLVNSEKRS